MARTMLDSEKRLRDFLYWFCVVVTIVQMAMGVSEFLGLPWFHMPIDMPMFYLFILAAYVARKEMDRWIYETYRKRRGETFFWMWALLVEGMFLTQSIAGRNEPLPHDVKACFTNATVVYLVSGTSRILHCRLWQYRQRYFARRIRH